MICEYQDKMNDSEIEKLFSDLYVLALNELKNQNESVYNKKRVRFQDFENNKKTKNVQLTSILSHYYDEFGILIFLAKWTNDCITYETKEKLQNSFVFKKYCSKNNI